GVYFVTQNPLDVPDTVLAQLGNRVQHALRAFTPRDQKAVKAAADTFRPNENLNAAQVITELGKGEALVSFLEGNGIPSVVERTMIRPPSARLGIVSEDERRLVIARSPVKGTYDTPIDRESAYETLKKRAEERQDENAGGWFGNVFGSIFGTTRKRGELLSPLQLAARSILLRFSGRFATQAGKWIGNSIGGSTGRSLGGSLGSAISRGALGGILRQQSPRKKE